MTTEAVRYIEDMRRERLRRMATIELISMYHKNRIALTKGNIYAAIKESE